MRPGGIGRARDRSPDRDALPATVTVSLDLQRRGVTCRAMTLIKPSERFRQEILPALDDYLNDSVSERLAHSLARALDHHVDWTFEYCNQNDQARLNGATDPKSFRRDLLGQCPELQMMNDLSDAAHHRFLTRRNDPPRVVVESTAAYSLQPSSESTGGSVTLCASGSVQLCVSGYDKPFLPAARNAVDFWRQWKD